MKRLRTVTSIVAGISVVLTVLLADELKEFGTAKGRTLHIVSGHPGALLGTADANWKRPPPKPVANVKLYWLRIDHEHGPQLFSTQSDTNGVYEIKLPAGYYLVECATLHGRELKRLEREGKTDTNSLINALFIVFDYDNRGRPIFDGEPGIEIKAGQTLHQDTIAERVFID